MLRYNSYEFAVAALKNLTFHLFLIVQHDSIRDAPCASTPLSPRLFLQCMELVIPYFFGSM